jgi:hypothetical protein
VCYDLLGTNFFIASDVFLTNASAIATLALTEALAVNA